MAFPISDAGYFTITEMSFTPKLIAPGDTVQFSITLKNTSGVAITKCSVYLSGKYKTTRSDGRNGSLPAVFLYGSNNYASDYGMAAISWGKNVSKTFSGSIEFSDSSEYPIDTSEYMMSLDNTNFILSFTTNASFANGTNFDNIHNLRGTNGEYLTMLSGRDKPVLAFSVERTPDDEGTALLTNIKLTAATDIEKLSGHGYTVKLYCSSEHDPATADDTLVPLNCTLEDIYAGITDSTAVITQTFSNGSDCAFLLQVTNGYETASAFSEIDRAFANVHLSGHTDGGVTFGGFCDRNNPGRFECYYPAFFYGGINIGGGSSRIVNIGENVVLCGHLTGSAKHIYISVPIGLAALSATTATVTNMVGWVRCAGKYGKSASYADGGDDYTSLVTSTVLDPATGIATIIIERSSAFNGSNNTALTFTVKTLTIELS